MDFWNDREDHEEVHMDNPAEPKIVDVDGLWDAAE